MKEAEPAPSTFSSEAPLSQLEKNLDRFGRYLLVFYLVFTLGLAAILKYGGFLADFSEYFKVSGFDPMNASGLAALYVAFLACRPSRNLVQLSVLLAVIAEFFYQLFVLPAEADLYSRLLTIGGGAGLVGLGCMVGMYFQANNPNAKARTKAFLLAGLCLLLYPFAAGKGIALLSLSTPIVVDSHAYRLEGALGFFPAQEVARFLYHNFAIHFAALAIYSRLPLFIFLGIYLSVRYPRICYNNVLIAFIAAGMLAFPLYFVLPMIGIDLFVGLPPWPLEQLPEFSDFQSVRAPNSYPRTCYPSLHTTWVFMFFFASFRLSRTMAAFSGMVVILTLLAALGPNVGHYSLDLFVGIPFCLGVVALSTPQSETNQSIRKTSMLFGLGSTVFFVCLFRFVPQATMLAPALSWLLVLIPVPVTFYLESQLARRSLAREE